jgi:hypothetical protein
MILRLSPDSVGSVGAETSTTSAGAVSAETTGHDAARSSSPQDTPGENDEDSPPPGDGITPVKSPANERLEQLLAANQPGGEDSPSSPEATAEESSGGAATPDGPNGAPTKPKAADVSQEQDGVFSKAFAERPEWKTAIGIARRAGPEAEKQMREQLRTIFQRENAVVAQVEKLKPAAAIADRIKRCTGDEAGLENSLRLIEGWFEGRPEAEQMLEELLTDLRGRTGKTLVSPDLQKRMETASQQMQDGLLDESQFEQLKADLLERERERAEKRSLETKVQRTERQATAAQQETMIADRTTALNDWEKNVARRDPDYARIQKLVTDRAVRLADERNAKEKRWLSPQEMTAICDEAYKTVKTELGGFIPKPRARSPLPAGDGPSGQFSEQEPSDPAQAIIWRRNRGRR